MEIKNLLLNEKNIELATNISEALREAKVEIQLNFWQELEEALAKEYKIVDIRTKYSKNLIEKFVGGNQNRTFPLT